jgi:hypothetical protein
MFSGEEMSIQITLYQLYFLGQMKALSMHLNFDDGRSFQTVTADY